MENTSQLILRNHDLLPAGATELWNPRPDGLFRELESADCPLALSSDRFGIYRTLDAMGAKIRFEAWTPGDLPAECVVLNLPREKARLEMRLHEAADRLGRGGKLFLVGENRAGIKSSPRLLERHFKHVAKRDSARHCTLFEATGAQAGEPFEPRDYCRPWSFDAAGRRIEVRSLPGVFAHGRLDAGTALLLDVLPSVQPSGRVLDFACGAGVIGLAVRASSENTHLTLLDDSALALESTRLSLEANGFEGDVVASNGLAGLDDHYDWIITNPPFHQGVADDLDVARAFFRQAGTFLAENGRILVVFNRHLPYEGWLRESFNHVECLSQNRVFRVVSARKSR